MDADVDIDVNVYEYTLRTTRQSVEITFLCGSKIYSILYITHETLLTNMYRLQH